MQFRVSLWAMALAVSIGGGCLVAGDKTPYKPAAKCSEYGTSVHFEDTPADAAKQAKQDEKLVLILHVSGHFEDPKLT